MEALEKITTAMGNQMNGIDRSQATNYAIVAALATADISLQSLVKHKILLNKLTCTLTKHSLLNLKRLHL